MRLRRREPYHVPDCVVVLSFHTYSCCCRCCYDRCHLQPIHTHPPCREGAWVGEARVDETGRYWWFSTMPECPIIDEKSAESKAWVRAGNCPSVRGHEHAANIGVAGSRGNLRDSPGTAELSAAIWLSAGAAAAISPAATAGVSSSATGRRRPQDAIVAPDEPGQPVARLGVINGEASVRRGDSGDWVAAALNAPLMAGDALSVGPNGSAELQLDSGNFVRLSGETEIRISDFESGRNQIQIARGLITYRVLRDSATQSEISTPAVAVRPVHASAVRVEVAPDGSTRIIVRHGDADVFTSKGTEHIHEGNMILVRGSPDDPEYQIVYAPARDGWDNWNDQRDAYIEGAQSNRYLSQDIQGGQDLDAAGRWGYDPAYGNVWTPNVAPTWAPYRDGQWVWEDYYGWTWVDSQPWGWAPFHYGSWYFRTGLGWSWFPGPRYGHYWWHPAMVGFFGFGGGVGFGVGFGFGNVGWIPLAPFEAFHPWYGKRLRVWRARCVPGCGACGSCEQRQYLQHLSQRAVWQRRHGRCRAGFSARRVSESDRRRPHATPAGVAGAGRRTHYTPSANNLRFSDHAISTATPRGEITNQRFFSRMQPGGATAARVPFAQQQAAVRSAFGARVPAQTFGGYRGAPSPARQGEWQRFGRPPTAAVPSPAQRAEPNGGWDRFGSPQPAPQRSAPSYQRPAPSYGGRPNSGGGGYRPAPSPSNQRSAPAPSYQRGAPAPSYQRAVLRPRLSAQCSAPGGNRGGGSGGGGHAPNNHGGRR